ncbi:hypothetical protein BJF79_15495 [Actinomadura sp. CNU-125]|uniref:hypothetical protein n=1 Tax=Actinomadura sp. CNU-125 TaxID=1904961 RepID=UPI000960304B|nr:hypothetical protein [Actinomadura sp. CNU-125]OLT21669.1 hypothetical protein BJF79_15495 [Actinomadura sp. CNU-125]
MADQQKPMFGAESARLAAIRARKTAASKGTWQVVADLDPADGATLAIDAGDVRVADVFVPAGVTPAEQKTAEADVEFMVHARADVTYLLTLVSRLRGENAALVETVAAADTERDRLEADRAFVESVVVAWECGGAHPGDARDALTAIRDRLYARTPAAEPGA